MKPEIKTDWNAYYLKPFKASSVTRKITSSVLRSCFKKFSLVQNPSIIEIGGANSCFYNDIKKDLQPSTYAVIDNNQLGLDKFAERLGKNEQVQLYNDSILHPSITITADIVFSVGLIEHFSERDTRIAIQNHFRFTKNNSLVVITYPTPTWLYRLIRFVAEKIGAWSFPDERPLLPAEVIAALPGDVKCLYSCIIWPIFLTQGVIVCRVQKD